MSRVSGEQITVKPVNNIYTALAAVAVLAQIVGLIAILVQAANVGGFF